MKRFLKDCKGCTSLQHILVVCLLGIATINSVNTVRLGLVSEFDQVGCLLGRYATHRNQGGASTTTCTNEEADGDHAIQSSNGLAVPPGTEGPAEPTEQ